MTNATITVDKERRRGANRPVLHILTSDGQQETFRDRGIVLCEDGSRGLRAVLITHDGEVYQTADGKDAIIDIPVVTLAVDDSLNDDQLISGWAAIGEFFGVSESTAKRMPAKGLLPKPLKGAGHRHVAFTRGQLKAARTGNG